MRKTDNEIGSRKETKRRDLQGNCCRCPALQSEGLGEPQRAGLAMLRCKPDHHQLEREDARWQKEATAILSKVGKKGKREKKRQQLDLNRVARAAGQSQSTEVLLLLLREDYEQQSLGLSKGV